MKLFITTLAVGLLSAASVSAQTDFIKFEQSVHDFGTAKEDNGDLKHSFKFTNITTSPIQLISVKASCGCTTPKWSTQTIQPGQSGEVTAEYDVDNRPGAFSKEISVRAAKVNPATGTVTDSLTADSEVLLIKGNIIARTKGPKDWYPFEDKCVRFSTNHVAFGDILDTEKRTKEFTMYNQCDKTINFTNVDVKAHIVFDFQGKTTLAPKDSMKVKVTYDAAKANDYDFLHERAYLATTNDSTKTVYVSSSVKKDFSKLTAADKVAGPKAKFDKVVHDFGTIKDSENVTTDFTISNVGQKPLEILKTKASCGCTASEPEKKLLQPGESTKIKVTFSAYGKSGQNSKQVNVITNDPDNHRTVLEIKSNIITDKKDDNSTKPH